MPRTIEPGLLRIFRYFTGVVLCYFAVLITYTALRTGQGLASAQIQWYLNFANYLTLFAYLSWPALQQRLRGMYLPLALAMATGMPILSNVVYLAPPQTGDLATAVEPRWLLFPTLLLPLVMIAWQYGFRAVLAFAICVAVVELSLLYPLVGRIDAETVPILGVPLIRAFAFAFVGQIVSLLVRNQHAQRRELLRANLKLSQHAVTLEQLAVSRERNRLARELHDTLAHTLSGQAVNLEAIKLALPPDQTEALGMLDQALQATREGLAETRRALKDLRSSPLENLGLAIAVRNLAVEAAARAGLALDLAVAAGIPEIGAGAEQACYRIAQEAIANVVHHAGARRLHVGLQMEGRILHLTVSDDGCGVDLGRVDLEGRHGLQGMQERAEAAGGELRVESDPGGGTAVRFALEVPGD